MEPSTATSARPAATRRIPAARRRPAGGPRNDSGGSRSRWRVVCNTWWMPRHQRDLLLRLIALFKLVKALVLIAIGVGALSLRNRHDGALGTWIHALVFDPHGKYVHEVVARISGLNTRQLAGIAIGSQLYAAVFTIEGIGLAL